MGVDWNEISAKSKGGTELLCRQLEARIPKGLMDNFQIIPSRMRTIDPEKVRIFWAHDLPGDPEADTALANGGWSRFHKIVFVSNWQMQAYISNYGIPWTKCVVMLNAIEPITDAFPKPTGKVRIAYTSTPHRGLHLLYPVFKKLAETHDDVELIVYSSFKVYGWDERDKEFEPLFEQLRADPNVKFTQGGENDEVREALKTSHILAYPSIWMETSCLCLMEGMSAGLICVHPNYAALYETAANWTMMYQFAEDPNAHCSQLHNTLEHAIKTVRSIAAEVGGPNGPGPGLARLSSQKQYADAFYGWELRALQWQAMLESLVGEDRSIKTPDGGMFVYKA